MQSQSPRYLRATATTVAAVAVVPSLLLGSAFLEFGSPAWDSSGDSGATQGLVASCIAAVLATSFAAFAFPSAAYYLYSRGRYSDTRLFWLLAVSLSAFSFIAALLASQFLGGSLRQLAFLWAIFFFMAAALTLPFSWLWARLAR